MELPPRARRIHGVPATPLTLRGTTSACAENTTPPTPNIGPCGNYLRVRGEYGMVVGSSRGVVELPPRARRILIFFLSYLFHSGTTSACAENTSPAAVRASIAGNYLRVRGEYHYAGQTVSISRELPPRARRILNVRTARIRTSGTTSACAENTAEPLTTRPEGGNYLRVRGEYLKTCLALGLSMELPPRARRIPHDLRFGRPQVGTTSACAENT